MTASPCLRLYILENAEQTNKKYTMDPKSQLSRVYNPVRPENSEQAVAEKVFCFSESLTPVSPKQTYE
ncbi:hypothetical protein F2P81_019921 [Scophthalmus maximus]|uniref:Uncharacterized protein n=1 Tax=Scophthalmus maximus TaxID=52904 RepID=A0A6A4S6K5_SCOMX|nr:hypothetical protein F2P81_019921 [Scophthalmus maximus]